MYNLQKIYILLESSLFEQKLKTHIRLI